MRLLRLGDSHMELRPDRDEAEEANNKLTMLPAPRSMRGGKLAKLVEEVSWDSANKHYMDLAFTGEPIRESSAAYLGFADSVWRRMRGRRWNMR
jgi:hypothetical protein